MLVVLVVFYRFGLTPLVDVAVGWPLVLRDRNQAFGVWRLAGPAGEEKAKVTGRLASNNAEIVRGWGIDGHGIVLQADWDLHDA